MTQLVLNVDSSQRFAYFTEVHTMYSAKITTTSNEIWFIKMIWTSEKLTVQTDGSRETDRCGRDSSFGNKFQLFEHNKQLTSNDLMGQIIS
jgi:hypothetical protein